MNENADKAEQLEADKHVAFYSAAVQAWIETRMERDRTLVTLSAGALAILVTILTTVGLAFKGQLWLYVASGAAFGTCIGISIWVYGQNARYIETILDSSPSNQPTFTQLDFWSLLSFLVGVATLLAIGLSTAHVKGIRNDRQEAVTTAPRAEEPARAGQARQEPSGARQDSTSIRGAEADTRQRTRRR